MSTTTTASRDCEIESGDDLQVFLSGLETDAPLFRPERLRERLMALDELDARFGGFGSDDPMICAGSLTRKRAKELRLQLETANAELYQSVRAEITRGGEPLALLRLLHTSASQSELRGPLPGLSFDCRDELVSGVLQLREPCEPCLQRSPEMVTYQPTPVRHILDLISATALAKDDVLVDLGSGLGHVPILISMVTGAQCLGIEVEADYVACARECAQRLNLDRVLFISQDVREADLSGGTVFYLYSPFSGSILTEVLAILRMESTRRSIKICSLGPCTRTIANEKWLRAATQPVAGSVSVFNSR